MPSVSSEPSVEQGLWSYLFSARDSAEESAYRVHYLSDDLRQLTAITLFAMAMMVVLSIIDLAGNTGAEGLPDGFIIRTVFIGVGCAMLLLVRRYRSSWVIDLGALVYSCLIAGGVFLFHVSGEVSLARMALVTTLFTYVISLAFSTYAIYTMPPVLLLLIGDGWLMFTSLEPEYVDGRSIAMAVMASSFVIAASSSALVQRSRFHAFSALRQVKTLSGLIPICASCKKIRKDDGYYEQIEEYLRRHSDAQFTHGLCDECAEDFR